MIPIVVLCGGMATRLYPITKTIPKSLILINKNPFISYQLDLFYKQGIRNVILCVGKFGKMIEDYVGNGSSWGLNVKYSYENENNLLGTGGAIKNALDLLPEIFIITYGDCYLDTNYINILTKFYEKNKSMLITIWYNKTKYHKNNILFKNNKILSYNKISTPDMQHIDYGIIIVNKSIFNNYKNKFDLSEIMSNLISKNKISVYEVIDSFHEVGCQNGIKSFIDNYKLNATIFK